MAKRRPPTVKVTYSNGTVETRSHDSFRKPARSTSTRKGSNEEYSAYIRSPAWQEVKQRYRASRLPQCCYVCGAAEVDLHHCTYKRFGSERLTDLMPLCRMHHVAAHQLLKAKRAEGANPSKWNNRTVAKRLKRELRSTRSAAR